MKIITMMLMISLTGFANQAVAYGSSSSKKACKPPRFWQFQPPHMAETAPQSEFSFLASGKTRPDSLQVTVKGQPVTVTVSKKQANLLVTGKLPADLQGTPARISIRATGSNKCKGKGGWLVKITGQ